MTWPSWFGLLKLNRAFTSGRATCHKPYRRTGRAHLLLEKLDDRTVPSGGFNFLNSVNNLSINTATASSEVVVVEATLQGQGNVPDGTGDADSLGASSSLAPQLRPFGVPAPGQGLLPDQSPWFPNAYGFGSGTQPGQPWAPAAYSVGLANQPSFPWGPTVAYGRGSGNSPAQGDQPTPANEHGENDNQRDEGPRNEGPRKEGQKHEGQGNQGGQRDEGTGNDTEGLRGPAGDPRAQALPFTAHIALFVGEPNGGEVDSGESGFPHFVPSSLIDKLALASIQSDGDQPIIAGVRFPDLLPLSHILLVSTLIRGHFSVILTGFAMFPAPVESAVELPKIDAGPD
jgi:hypothetical protein